MDDTQVSLEGLNMGKDKDKAFRKHRSHRVSPTFHEGRIQEIQLLAQESHARGDLSNSLDLVDLMQIFHLTPCEKDRRKRMDFKDTRLIPETLVGQETWRNESFCGD